MSKKYEKKRPEKDFCKWVIIGLLLMLLPLVYYRPGYDELSSKEIQVKYIGYTSGRYASNDYYLTTVDGDNLQIRGDFSYDELKETLQPNTIVTVKYYRGMYILWKTDYIYELTYAGDQLVKYAGSSQLENQIVMIFVGISVILIGFMFYNYQTQFIRKMKRKLKKPLKNR
uniref:hypothetical protein n=1 Tax=Acetatifactor sp. TaxID=1872090 RepID=UPI0040563139